MPNYVLSAQELRALGMSYRSLPIDTINQIDNTDALAVWTYIQTKAENWVIRNKELQNHFKVGSRKIQKAISYLVDKGFFWRYYPRNKNGTLAGTVTICGCIAKDKFESALALLNKGFNREVKKPKVGEMTPLNKDQYINKRSSTKGNAQNLNAYEKQPKPEPKPAPEIKPAPRPAPAQPVGEMGKDYFYLHSLDENQIPQWAQTAPTFYATQTPADHIWRGFVLYYRANRPDELITIQKLSQRWDSWVKREKTYEPRNATSQRPPRQRQERGYTRPLTAVEIIQAGIKREREREEQALIDPDYSDGNTYEHELNQIESVNQDHSHELSAFEQLFTPYRR